MPINILMPALSPTMEKGNLAKWLKKEGDKVQSGDVIAEIETDKATMEVEAVDEGTLAKIVVPEGTQDVAVNDVIAVLAGDGEDVKAAGGKHCAKGCAATDSRRRFETGGSASLVLRGAGRAGFSGSSQERRTCSSHRGGRDSAGLQGRGFAHQWPRPHFLLAARTTFGEGRGHRACAHHRVRPAWQGYRARC